MNHLNHRPIALTSVVCKVMERIVNVRLLDFFDQKGTLDTIMWRQSQTNNYRPSFVSGSHSKEGPSKRWVSPINLRHIEKAFDLTLRHCILMDINEAEIEGRMFSFVQVKVNETLCDTKIQTEGIHQGSVVSPTFFLLKINKIVAELLNDNRF